MGLADFIGGAFSGLAGDPYGYQRTKQSREQNQLYNLLTAMSIKTALEKQQRETAFREGLAAIPRTEEVPESPAIAKIAQQYGEPGVRTVPRDLTAILQDIAEVSLGAGETAPYTVLSGMLRGEEEYTYKKGLRPLEERKTLAEIGKTEAETAKLSIPKMKSVRDPETGNIIYYPEEPPTEIPSIIPETKDITTPSKIIQPLPGTGIKILSTGLPKTPKSLTSEQLKDISLHDPDPTKRQRAKETIKGMQEDKIKVAVAEATAKLNAEMGFSAGVNIPALAQTSANLPAGQRNEQALQQMPVGIRSTVQQLVDYKIPLPSGFALRSPYWQRVLSYATLYDPTFDATQYTVRLKLRQDFASGKSAQNVRSLNTAIGHLDTLKKTGEKLNNSPVQLWNKIANYGITATGDPRVTNFMNAANAVTSEMANVFKGMGATDQEIKAWRENLNAAMSPDQITGSINTLLTLMNSRLEALKNQYETGMGKPLDFRLLSSTSRKILAGLGINVDEWEVQAGKTISTGAKKTGKVGKYTYMVE